MMQNLKEFHVKPGYVLYIVLIFVFGYVYTLMELNPKEMSENLDKSRAYIPGITPGERTQAYLKGTIVNIEYGEKKIVFTIDVKTFLSETQCKDETFEVIKTTDDGTRISLYILSWDDELSEADKIKTVIPFQLGYAISIHKAQGLEYKSVKIVIPSSNAEKITHSIFYTAITRAKEKLKINL